MATKKIGSSPVRLAVIGTGGMAATHAKAFNQIKGCRLVAAVDVDLQKARDFAQAHGIPAYCSSTDEMLKTIECDAVTIVVPDALHAPIALSCLARGKHVLCEKPLAVTYAQARAMVVAARRAGVIHMINFSYRNWPAIHLAASIVQSGDIGEIRHVEASYLQSWLSSKMWGDWRTSPGWLWRLSKRHGSQGVLGDVGVHIIDFVTYPAGPIRKAFCTLKAFPKAPRNRIGAYQLDANDSAVIAVQFKNDAIGTIHLTRWASGHANRLHLKISGTRGAIELDSERSTTSLQVCRGADVDTARWKTINAAPTATIYQQFIKSIIANKQHQPDFVRGAEIQRVIDLCFKSDAAQLPMSIN
jgi:predicted dehydrogenase